MAPNHALMLARAAAKRWEGYVQAGLLSREIKDDYRSCRCWYGPSMSGARTPPRSCRPPARAHPGRTSPPRVTPCSITKTAEKVWADDLATGKRRDLGHEEDHAFWAWAAVEILRLTDHALGQAATAGRFAHGDLAAILAHQAGARRGAGRSTPPVSGLSWRGR